MDRDIVLLLLGAAISAIAWIIKSILDIVKEGRNKKIDLKYRVYDDRLSAYKKMYSSLVDIHEILIDVSTDICVLQDHSKFDPMKDVLKVHRVFMENQIYFSMDTLLKLKVLVYNLDVMDQQIVFDKDDKKYAKEFVELVGDRVRQIRNCMECMRKDLGLEYLDKI